MKRSYSGAFTTSLRSGKNIVSLWSHDSNKPLGSTSAGTLRLYDSPEGLNIEVSTGHTTWGDDALEAVKRGDVQGFSFGFSIVKERMTDEGVRQLVEVNLREVSPCVFPAYPESSAIVRQKPQHFNRRNKMANLWDEFDSDNDFYRAVIRASNKDVDPRLQMRAATGLGGVSCFDWGILVDQFINRQPLNG